MVVHALVLDELAAQRPDNRHGNDDEGDDA